MVQIQYSYLKKNFKERPWANIDISALHFASKDQKFSALIIEKE